MNNPRPTTPGALADVPVYLRWENTDPPHRKFYEIEVELSLFYPKVLTRRWGRIGTPRVHSLQRVMASADAVGREVTAVGQRRGWHGYALVKEIRAIGARASAAPTPLPSLPAPQELDPRWAMASTATAADRYPQRGGA